ncbi:tail protein [Tistrella bauzanensis]|uniref:Tail protein n=1 Tax=Tistrella bauzanensis TaxID=657419 RepID=A0ABQ1J3A4_9PROT|nr:tail fiber protein [Tistrella bauzanensis]GGB59005.1 tail protein [Tistrella bauzanensis]
MADPFYGEIRAFAFAFAPQDWAYCIGQQVSVQQNQALAAVIGTIYGGNLGQNYFNLPNLQGQAPMGSGTGTGLTPRTVAQSFGTEAITLSISQLPVHTHTATALVQTVGTGGTLTPSSSTMLGRTISAAAYAPVPASAPPLVELDERTLDVSGQGQAHENRQPFLTLNMCICLNGYFPVRPS